MPALQPRFLLRWLFVLAAIASSPIFAQLSVVPANPTAVDLVRLRWTHVGCTNPDSVQVSLQASLITVSADRTFAVDCGTIQYYFDEYTIGRLPRGEYDVQLIANPPPGTLGPSLLIGPIHLSVGSLPPTGTLLPHDDYSDVWLDPNEPGQALTVKQSGTQLVAGWNVYDTAGRPIWYTLQPGGWTRDSANNLMYHAVVYRTTGPYWAEPFNTGALTITPVGSANFIPRSVSRARFEYVIDGIAGSKELQRFVF